MAVFDFRSDTVTKPTPAMRRAMAEAEVGDDVLGDDPTVARLEREAADLFGREAALFVPSGSQGNLIAACLHARRGEEVALSECGHSLDWEMAGLAALAGVQARVLPAPRGAIDVDAARVALRPEAGGFRPACRLLIVENTHNFFGGAIVPRAHLEALYDATRERGARLHLDGARLWHACVATGTPPARYGALADSIMVCLSKGLGAPVGSLLVGDRDFIAQARHVRKMLGGGMRQVGVLAAPARIALADMRDRLADDHERATKLARGLGALPGVTLPLGLPETNILFVRWPGRDGAALAATFAAAGVRAMATGGPSTLRFVTHFDVGDDAVAAALGVARAISAGPAEA